MIYDSNSTTTFTQIGTQNFLYQSPSYERSTSLAPSKTMNVEVPLAPQRRKRSELEGNSISSNTGNNQLDIINNLVHSINKLAQSIDLMDVKDHSCWNLIKKVSNLDK